MQFAKRAFYQSIQLAPLSLLKQLDPNRLLLPYHHLVSDAPVPHIKHLYPFKGIAAFEQDLDYLLQHFTPVTLPEVIRSVQEQRPLSPYSFLLSFDDGLRQVKDFIAPMLYRKGIPGAFFLNTGFLDNKLLFYKFKISLLIEALQQTTYSHAVLTAVGAILPGQPAGGRDAVIAALRRITWHNRHLADEAGALLEITFDDYLSKEKPFLESAEVQQLIDQGFGIGGHSIDHPYYTQLTLEEQLHQTCTSVNDLAVQFQLPYKAFAFPHSDAGVSRSFFDTVFDPAMPLLDIVFGTANHRRDIHPAILHRFNCERPHISIQQAVKGVLLYDVVKRRLLPADISRNPVAEPDKK
ncbi:polysaccharide deacetylase family protein [Chitinophaga nivalis]|uniref:Polysaccharide deacetylase family protein n=1 Tax=Chitinophaga nivalis TaxID=2991709 RepID=A0ABT3ILR0_9BACT|nr:polysaccharide deacetylase family protein [Chitinophaga nivalis]MCW3465402.1 polysaccharide deacetylase family protein [Chitinophaga nivalis]MCW3484906.1 polysaccharide deacetylase family protein [Chitinophaga nivalis]